MEADTSTLQVEWIPIDQVFLNPANPRENEEAVPKVAASIRRFGWRQPIVVKRSGEVVAGNTRLKAAKALGMAIVPITRFEGPDIEATAYSIADNKVAEIATWDETALAKLLEELRAEDALDGVGFDDSEIEDLIDTLSTLDVEINEIEDPGAEDPPVNPVTRPGDLWILGNHKLLCGDSTCPDDLSHLMNGDKAVLFSTDPPYCVNYTGMDRPIHDGKPSGKDWSHVYREVDIKDMGIFLDKVFTACLPHISDNAGIYIWHAHVQQPLIASIFEKHDLLLHQVIIWAKPAATFGYSYYRWKHEPCAFGWRRGHKPEHGLGKLETIWEVDWEGKARITGEHPTIKPLRLFEIPMEQHTKLGATVLEPFSGSGSQILAAERLGRRCRALEIQPAFVDVAIHRWEKATGKKAYLDADGLDFDEVSEDRGINRKEE